MTSLIHHFRRTLNGESEWVWTDCDATRHQRFTSRDWSKVTCEKCLKTKGQSK